MLRSIVRPIVRSQVRSMLAGGDFTGLQYDSLAAAEASGDTWSNGDVLTFTDGTADHIYISNAEQHGHSGLIPHAPYGDSELVTGFTFVDGMGEGTDPDNESWTDASTGTKTTEYDFDTNGGKSRMRKLDTAGQARLNQATISTSHTHGLAIVRGIQMTADTQATNNETDMYVTAYVDGVNDQFVRFQSSASGIGPNWRISVGAGFGTHTDSGLAVLSEHDVLIFVKSNKWAVWGNGALIANNTNPTTTAAPYGVAIMAGTAAVAGAVDLEFSTIVNGYLATA